MGRAMSKQPPEKLQSAGQAISTAVMILRMEQETIDAFLKECRDIENFGSILHPTLYNRSERKAVSALLEPLFQSAKDFIRAYDEHMAKARAAIEKVKA